MATDELQEVPSSPFKSILNFRDVGQAMNCLQSDVFFREGRLYRSARPDEASIEDRDSLVRDKQIRSIIDLRSKSALPFLLTDRWMAYLSP